MNGDVCGFENFNDLQFAQNTHFGANFFSLLKLYFRWFYACVLPIYEPYDWLRLNLVWLETVAFLKYATNELSNFQNWLNICIYYRLVMKSSDFLIINSPVLQLLYTYFACNHSTNTLLPVKIHVTLERFSLYLLPKICLVQNTLITIMCILESDY